MLQFEKAPFPIDFMPFPIVTDTKPHLQNALLPIDVTLLGMDTDVRLEQSEKAPSPIDVTLLPIVTDINLQQLKKALIPIDATLLPIVTDVRL